MHSHHRATTPLRHIPVLLVVHTYLVAGSLNAGNRFENRYEYYQEEDGRVRVDSDYSLFSVDLNDSLVLDGTLLYSSISGASPTGLPPDTKNGQVPLAELRDERIAGTLGLAAKYGDHVIKGGIAISDESDYQSLGLSLLDTIALNNKNTEFSYGAAYTADVVGANGSDFEANKDSYDFLLGVSQILGPETLISANLALGWKSGYLSDPYKLVLIDDWVYNENRPGDRASQLLTIQLTQFLAPLDAAVEVTYRLGHDNEGMWSNTAMIALPWKLADGKFTLRPMFRYYRQTAADFYDVSFSGDPEYYSSDYRVSGMDTFSFGLQARWQVIADKLALDVGYERYVTRGTGDAMPDSAYPTANIARVGFALDF